jgi:ABC-type amino acid transport system permease subunit
MYQTEVVSARSFAIYSTFALAALLYLALTIPLSRLVAALELRLNRYRVA